VISVGWLMVVLGLQCPPPYAGITGGGSSGPAVQQGAAVARIEALTDGNGQFMFRSVAAGSYFLLATRAGYIQASYGQTAPPNPLTAAGGEQRLELKDGQRLVDVTIKIWRQASLSGRITDEAGESVVGANVRVLRVNGPTSLAKYSSADQVETDDRGIYRFAELMPGDYVVMFPVNVMAVPVADIDTDLIGQGVGLLNSARRLGDQLVTTLRPGGSDLIPDQSGRVSVYPLVFFPGVRSLASAISVALASGEERIGVDFSIRPVSAFTMGGRVAGPSGAVPNTVVKIVPEGLEGVLAGASVEISSVVTRRDGTFTAWGIPQGAYRANVVKLPDPSNPVEPVLWGRAEVSVGDANLEGIEIQLAPGGTISGRVEFEPGSSTPVPTPEQLQRGRLSVSPADGGPAVRGVNPPVRPDGTFKTQGYLPGRYNLTMALSAPGWTLKSIMVGGRNVVNNPVDFAGIDLEGVVVVFTDKAGEISGTVANAEAETDVGIMVIPADYQSWIQSGMNPRVVRSTGASRDGAFRLPGLVAGEYVAIAVSAQTMLRCLQNSQLMMTVARQGVRFSLGDREKRAMALTLVQVR
jgi:hypothetical protein